MVETMGFEPTTPALQTRCSSQLSYVPGIPVRHHCAIPAANRHMIALPPYHRPMTDASPTVHTTPEFAAFSALAVSRRTSLRIDPDRPVDPSLVAELCRMATWAPNHHLTEPWRFAVVTGENRAELGARAAAYQAEMGETVEARLHKTRGKYLRAPISLAVACVVHPDPVTHAEDRDAVAAGIQNILLGAAALGLASYWGSGLVTQAPQVKALCGFGPDDALIGIIYLGWPTSHMASPGRSEPQIRWM